MHVDAGRTTWIDVDRTGTAPIRIAGRVLDASGPVAGARVRVYPEWITTGPDGEFEARSAFPHTAFLRFNVERDGITTRFEFPPMQANDREWRGELVLGSEALFVRRSTPTAHRARRSST